MKMTRTMIVDGINALEHVNAAPRRSVGVSKMATGMFLVTARLNLLNTASTTLVLVGTMCLGHCHRLIGWVWLLVVLVEHENLT